MFRNSLLCGFIMLLLPILFTGCVTSLYQYEWWEYEPIDYNIHHKVITPEYVYIPRYKPKPLYLYENFWYSEPYTIIIYEDSTGYRLRQKVPNSHLKMRLNKSRPYLKRGRDVESIMKRVDEEMKKKRYNLKKRGKNTKVVSTPVDNNRERTRGRDRIRKRTRGRI